MPNAQQFTHQGYRAFNDRLALSLEGGAAPDKVAVLIREARAHLARARRGRFAAPISVEALHDAVATTLTAIEAGR